MNDLTALIHQQLQDKGDMPFVEFMQLALYHPQWGYYNSGLQKFGPGGDFITAPELTPLFGYTLAKQCQAILSTLSEPILFEFGAGSGRLCIDILTHLEQLNSLPEAYYILEVSGHLRLRQQARIQEEIPHLATKVVWLNQWPAKPFNGIIIANEVLDAMPVHRFLQTKDQLLESVINLDANSQLCEDFKPSLDARLISYVKQALPAQYPYQSEANLFITDWIQQCANMLAQGVIFLIDYGFPRHEYYHPDRHQGTIMCHYQHQMYTNPLLHIGQQDITAHVDFTHVAEAADAAGLHVAGFTNQAAFLLGNGLLSLLEDITDSDALIKANQAVKQLIQPSEMGELFKVMALTCQWDMDLAGFQWHDKRVSL